MFSRNVWAFGLKSLTIYFMTISVKFYFLLTDFVEKVIKNVSSADKKDQNIFCISGKIKRTSRLNIFISKGKDLHAISLKGFPLVLLRLLRKYL